MMRRQQRSFTSVAVFALLLLIGCDSRDHEITVSRASSSPRHGGEAIVLLNSEFAGAWPTGLDPATNTTGGSNLSLMNAIFGGLVQLTADADGRNPRIVGVLAESYDIEDEGRTLVLHLRHGVRFSDGTPFDAQAVKFNFERNLASPCSCSSRTWPWSPEGAVTTPDNHTVVLHFSRPYVAAIHSLSASNLNWVASPTALEKMGEDQFRITPVGAGPFRVVRNQLSSRLELERNPHYWQKDRPYLDRLIFQSIGGDQAAYQALLAGDAHAYEGMSSPTLIKAAEDSKQLIVTRQPANSPYVIQLNTATEPFNDIRAREAIYYATDAESINKGLFYGWSPVSQMFTAPGGLFHHDKIPGYRTHDLAKARELVQQLGGLHVKLTTLRSYVAEQVVTALQTQWKRAGITTTLHTADLGTLIKDFESRKWQAMLQTVGSYDPEAGAGLRFRFRSGSLFSGVNDETLDNLLLTAAAESDHTKRDQLYFEAGRYISDKAYAPFLFTPPQAQLARGIEGPGLTTPIPPVLIATGVFWQDVWLTK